MIFEPIIIENLTIKNRLVMAPMCMYKSDKSGMATDFHLHHYVARAMGGIGLVTVEETGVLENGKITDSCLGIYDDAHIEGLTKIVKSVHENGAKIAIQLAHAGRKSTVTTTPDIYGPTSEPFSDNFKTPVEMTKEHINEVIEAFGNAAARAKKAGFDMVQIHAAHGYLLSSFLSPLTNLRKDEYGSENCAKLLLEITKAVKSNFSGPVSIRVNGYDQTAGGVTSESISKAINFVKNEGICLVDVSSGGVVQNVNYDPYPAHQIEMATTIKKLTELPVIGGGVITEANHIDEILKSKHVDMIYLGRKLLTEPFFPITAAEELGKTPDWPYTNQALKSMGKYGK